MSRDAFVFFLCVCEFGGYVGQLGDFNQFFIIDIHYFEVVPCGKDRK